MRDRGLDDFLSTLEFMSIFSYGNADETDIHNNRYRELISELTNKYSLEDCIYYIINAYTIKRCPLGIFIEFIAIHHSLNRLHKELHKLRQNAKRVHKEELCLENGKYYFTHENIYLPKFEVTTCNKDIKDNSPIFDEDGQVDLAEALYFLFITSIIGKGLEVNEFKEHIKLIITTVRSIKNKFYESISTFWQREETPKHKDFICHLLLGYHYESRLPDILAYVRSLDNFDEWEKSSKVTLLNCGYFEDETQSKCPWYITWKNSSSCRCLYREWSFSKNIGKELDKIASERTVNYDFQEELDSDEEQETIEEYEKELNTEEELVPENQLRPLDEFKPLEEEFIADEESV